jgi:alpha-L-fucosidase
MNGASALAVRAPESSTDAWELFCAGSVEGSSCAERASHFDAACRDRWTNASYDASALTDRAAAQRRQCGVHRRFWNERDEAPFVGDVQGIQAEELTNVGHGFTHGQGVLFELDAHARSLCELYQCGAQTPSRQITQAVNARARCE